MKKTLLPYLDFFTISAKDVTEDSDGFSNRLIPCSRDTLPFSIRDFRHAIDIGSDETASGTGSFASSLRHSWFPESGMGWAAMCSDTEQHVIRICSVSGNHH